MYRDSLEAALLRADAAERELKQLKEEKPLVKPIKVKTPRTPGIFRRGLSGFGRGLAAAWPIWLVLGLVALVIGGPIVFCGILPSRHQKDWSCYVAHSSCTIPNLLCDGKYVIVGKRPWWDDSELLALGIFDTVQQAKDKMKQVNCPEIKE